MARRIRSPKQAGLFDPPSNTTPPRRKNDASNTKADDHLTVSQVTTMVSHAIEAGLPAKLHVVGQISNITRSQRGHLYLTLKDDRASLDCVLWAGNANRIQFNVEDGLEVVASGNISVYPPRGSYQLVADKLTPYGVGAMELAFRQLKEKLEAQGLFDPQRKRSIPPYPLHIAVVTSPTGAAVQDILRTLDRRWPVGRILIVPTVVQGELAPGSIADALDRMNQYARTAGTIDVCILARGGGSLEDLWAFNTEPVALAIARSNVPIISGVGHEVDVTIADLIADLRAATPTGAAEMVAPDLADLVENFRAQGRTLYRQAAAAAAIGRQRLDRIEMSPIFSIPQRRLTGLHADMSSLVRRLTLAIQSLAKQQRSRLDRSTAARIFTHPHQLCRQWRDTLTTTENRLRTAASARLNSLDKRLTRHELVLARIQPAGYLQYQQRHLHSIADDLTEASQRRTDRAARDLQQLTGRLIRISPGTIIKPPGKLVDTAGRRMHTGMRHAMQMRRTRLDALARRLESVGYRQTLRRGYAVARTSDTNALISTVTQVKSGKIVQIEVSDGTFDSKVL